VTERRAQQVVEEHLFLQPRDLVDDLVWGAVQDDAIEVASDRGPLLAGLTEGSRG